ncbi:helix-turn-helix domain-containing protein [Nocardia sp. NPDC004568]|uniref:ArsR/SmtB family transcription factor n=1 Tax=Nocardia sp. NPDC004568 TaxID=3154551 RepID=UPI0033BB2E59
MAGPLRHRAGVSSCPGSGCLPGFPARGHPTPPRCAGCGPVPRGVRGRGRTQRMTRPVHPRAAPIRPPSRATRSHQSRLEWRSRTRERRPRRRTGRTSNSGAVRVRGYDVGTLVSELGISQSLVSKHLRVLREAGVAEVEVAGKRRVYRLTEQPLPDVISWVQPYIELWSSSSEQLAQALDDDEDDHDG